MQKFKIRNLKICHFFKIRNPQKCHFFKKIESQVICVGNNIGNITPKLCCRFIKLNIYAPRDSFSYFSFSFRNSSTVMLADSAASSIDSFPFLISLFNVLNYPSILPAFSYALPIPPIFSTSLSNFLVIAIP